MWTIEKILDVIVDPSGTRQCWARLVDENGTLCQQYINVPPNAPDPTPESVRATFETVILPCLNAPPPEPPPVEES